MPGQMVSGGGRTSGEWVYGVRYHATCRDNKPRLNYSHEASVIFPLIVRETPLNPRTDPIPTEPMGVERVSSSIIQCCNWNDNFEMIGIYGDGEKLTGNVNRRFKGSFICDIDING